jgi:hypothetical protein
MWMYIDIPYYTNVVDAWPSARKPRASSTVDTLAVLRVQLGVWGEWRTYSLDATTNATTARTTIAQGTFAIVNCMCVCNCGHRVAALQPHGSHISRGNRR